MAQDNFEPCVAVTLDYEGGLSMIRSDPGNWTSGKVGSGVLRGTNMGIAAASHPSVDIQHLTKDEAASIYKIEYWEPAGCDALPLGLDLCHFDGTVNSGRGNSSRWLKTSGTAAGAISIHAYSEARLHSLESFKVWATFGKGLSARVAGVEAKALKMAGATSTVIAKAGSSAATVAKGASIVATTATVTTGAVLSQVPSHPYLALLAALVSGVGAVFSAFHASTSGARAAVLAHAATTA